jgi:hypothetical protein
MKDTSLDRRKESTLDVLRSPILLKRFFVLLLAWYIWEEFIKRNFFQMFYFF